MSESIDVSVVIGFRNWGLRRLELAVRSLEESFGTLSGEVIVSDFGSDDFEDNRLLIESLGARYVFTPSQQDPWSRSRALNAGFAVSTGAVMISTDADMLFSPGSMERIGSLILGDNKLCVLLQCRDLPQDHSEAKIYENGFDWEDYERDSRLRPRWGMGGMMAVHRDIYLRIRGLDERMNTYGGEDIDFATRAKRAGSRLFWLDDRGVRMYHMWHPPTKKMHAGIEDAVKAIDYNKDIVYNDKSFVRNLPVWIHKPESTRPLVTVAIATYNRAGYLRDSIHSVLYQTMQDFEIVIIDDGSTDNTEETVRSFEDPRIRYIKQDNSGIASARNRATDEALGDYIAVHDDDDLMTPWRLEKHFRSIVAGTHGSFGSFVNFDDQTGAMKLYASKKLDVGTITQSGGAPGHGTWLVETDVLRSIRYDESLTSGVDNNLALRMVRSGVRLVHTGEIMMLRRMHPGQVTVTDEETQTISARQTRRMFSFGISEQSEAVLRSERGPTDYVAINLSDRLDTLIPYLPDHLVSRSINLPGNDYPAGAPPKGDFIEELDPDINHRYVYGVLRNAKLSDLVALRSIGAEVEISAHLMSQMEPLSEIPQAVKDEGEFDNNMLQSAIRRSAERLAHSGDSSKNESVEGMLLAYLTMSPRVESLALGMGLRYIRRVFTSAENSIEVAFIYFTSLHEVFSFQTATRQISMNLIVLSHDDRSIEDVEVQPLGKAD